jgi:hypothetical protein
VRAFLLALAEKAYSAIELAEHPVGLPPKLTLTLIECVATETAHRKYLSIRGIIGSLATFQMQETESNAGEEQR